MVSLTALAFPILLAAVVVFFASSIVHTVLPFHRSDFRRLPAEDEVMDALRKFNVPPGDYLMPSPTAPDAMRDPKLLEKMNQGPVATITFMKAGPFSMVRNLTLWFIYCLVVSVFVAYVTSRALGPGASYQRLVQFAGTTAFMGYTLALWQQTIWYNKSWATTLRSTIDGLVYSLLTAAIFGWLWPH